ncbi:hypothetical protein EDB86DRAFT_3088060 [Lactarius hatsudake]|nr:hypothetical protein EDB86DRAFT_3088060 [Lactarius hatsudake]
MSQASPEYMSVTEAAIGPGTGTLLMRGSNLTVHTPASTGGLQYPPQLDSDQAPHGMSDLVDGSGAIFLMYLERAEEEDKKKAENWKADAEGTHNDLPSIPSLMSHPTGRTPHDSWANRCRPMPHIFPELMGHPTSVRSILFQSNIKKEDLSKGFTCTNNIRLDGHKKHPSRRTYAASVKTDAITSVKTDAITSVKTDATTSVKTGTNNISKDGCHSIC